MISLEGYSNGSKSPVLKAVLVILLLRYAIKGLSVSNIDKFTKDLSSYCYFPPPSRQTIKKYLFYLIEYNLIFYDGTQHSFIIKKSGINLLYIIVTSIKKYSLDIQKLSIGFE